MRYHSESYEPALRRVVFRLEDGRLKYATHNGDVLEWEMCEVRALRENIRRLGQPIFSPDFSFYACNFPEYRERIKQGTFIRITGFYTEMTDEPLDRHVII